MSTRDLHNEMSASAGINAERVHRVVRHLGLLRELGDTYVTESCISLWVLANGWSESIQQNMSPSSCLPDPRPDIHPNCDEEEENGFKAQCAEVILSDRFKPCHAAVSPEAFLSNCVYDMCEYDGMESTLCDNVDAYAKACKSVGVTISWRNSTFCRE